MTKNIEWLSSGSNPEWTEENYSTGGAVYDTTVRKILRQEYELHVSYIARGRAKSLVKRAWEWASFIRTMRNVKLSGDIVFRDFFTTVFSPIPKGRINIPILHHLEVDSTRFPRIYRALVKQYCRQARNADCVVVVSEYWQNFLRDRSVERTRVIYNSFDTSQFNFTCDQLNCFRESKGIPRDRPLIYLGNAKADKGYTAVARELAGIDATLIATGRGEPVDGTRVMFLDYSDYLKLLTISDIVLTMSTLQEGWCRTAHEAMLCRTPVIGSGSGGMMELLQGGGQRVCRDVSSLREEATHLLGDDSVRKQLGERGFAFASRFDSDYFRKQWVDLVNEFSSRT